MDIERDPSLYKSAYSKNNTLEFRYDEEKLKKENKYKLEGEAFPQKLNCFNWGACILTPIWGIFNNTPIALAGIILGLIPMVGWLLSMGFSLYCGIKGNEWAWKNKEWVDLKELHISQRKWAIWAVGIELFLIIGLCLVVSSFIFNTDMESVDSIINQLQIL